MILILGAAVQLAAAQRSAAASEPVPRAPLQNFVSADDYPEGVARSAARPVGLTLTVGPGGRVTDCLITASSGTSLLDAVTCRLLRSRSRFTPARDAGGTAIGGEVRATIDWAATISGSAAVPQVRAPATARPRVPQAPWESISRLRVRMGQIGSCHWHSTGPVPPPPSSNACQNPQLAGMALGLAAENKADFNKAEVVVTLRMPHGGLIAPLPAAPEALVDLATELEIGADGTLTSCRFTRELVRSSAPRRPDCRSIFAGPYGGATNRQDQPIATKRRAELRVEVK
jgi:hypothetical protein